jgi:hypothetical protein
LEKRLCERCGNEKKTLFLLPGIEP